MIGLAIEVHRQLGPLSSSAYEECLCCELERARFPFRPGRAAYCLQIHPIGLVAIVWTLWSKTALILELKTVERLMPIHDRK